MITHKNKFHPPRKRISDLIQSGDLRGWEGKNNRKSLCCGKDDDANNDGDVAFFSLPGNPDLYGGPVVVNIMSTTYALCMHVSNLNV